jgi:DNA-directed RNA polymerase subunit F
LVIIDTGEIIMTPYTSAFAVGDWIKLCDTTEKVVVYAKIVDILPQSSRGIIIEYMEWRFSMNPESLEKVTDSEMMLWKLEHADDKKG